MRKAAGIHKVVYWIGTATDRERPGGRASLPTGRGTDSYAQETV